MKYTRYFLCTILSGILLSSCGESKSNSSSTSPSTTPQTETLFADTSLTVESTADSITDTSGGDLNEIRIPDTSSVNNVQISTDWSDCEFVFDGIKIKFGETKLKDLLNADWKLDADSLWLQDSLDEILYGGEYENLSLCKDAFPQFSESYETEIYLTVDINNYGDNSLSLNESYISGFSVNVYNAVRHEKPVPTLILQSNVGFGSKIGEIKNIFGSDLFEESDTNAYAPSTSNSDENEKITELTFAKNEVRMELSVSSTYGLSAATIKTIGRKE